MSLPKHVKLSECVADPGKRANHIYYPRTDEVFHVSPELAASILKMQSKAGDKEKAAAYVPDTETPQTPADNAETEPGEETGLTLKEGENSNKTTVEHDRVELLTMAETLGLQFSLDISDADLMALVEKAVQE